ncbi:MAG: hypothetical protein E6J14_07970 [Chloroflexi bacterium]|nr:MAG: hypothetical protein E6J14_07970 [Chloroflexota bacterium]
MVVFPVPHSAVSFMDLETGAALEGEEPRDATARDVEYWLSIYDGLLSFTEEMLQRTRDFMREAPMPARRHLETTNVRIMEEELAQFRARLDYWRQQRDEARGQAQS